MVEMLGNEALVACGRLQMLGNEALVAYGRVKMLGNEALVVFGRVQMLGNEALVVGGGRSKNFPGVHSTVCVQHGEGLPPNIWRHL